MILAWFACRSSVSEVGDFTVTLDRDAGSFSLAGPNGAHLDDVVLLIGEGDARIEMQFGASRFTELTRDLTASAGFDRSRAPRDAVLVPVLDAAGGELGELGIGLDGADALTLSFLPVSAHDRIGLSARCDDADHFLGLGSHAMDTDHVGEAFALWVSEPGIGKSETDAEPAGWPIEGARHATSFPMPFLLRPHHPDGLLVDTGGRVDVDLCATDPDRFELVAWDEGPGRWSWLTGARPLDVVRRLTDETGRVELPPPWVFGAWGDAIRGPERVREVSATLRDNRVPATVIWSEDWKGANETATGYRLDEEWFVDRTKYPEPEALAAELEADGFHWLAYFAPFVGEGDRTWDDALLADVLVKRADGSPYTFPGVALGPVGLVDVSSEPGRAWAVGKMQDALAIGFDGWMADYGEWLPTDAVLANGMTGLEAHNLYPEWWQETNREAIAGHDATFFVRSGWTRTGGVVPVVWAGDQRTSFDTDDGLPTVLALGLGLSAGGVPIFTHDTAGYQSVGNPPSDQELWMRWASLGAFSPIFRLHHGSFDTENHQFDSTPRTLAHYTAMAREHVRLFPYRYGLAARAAEDGTPMILPVSFVAGEDWARTDAWMLGEALLVAPVTVQGAVSREVSLPDSVRWWDWWTGAEVTSGTFAAPLDTPGRPADAVGPIPVFAAGGTTIPTFATVPDTLDPRDTGGDRVVYLFGGGGPFREADGTTYRPEGTPSGTGTVRVTLRAGEVSVAGLTVHVDGPVERTYTFVAR